MLPPDLLATYSDFFSDYFTFAYVSTGLIIGIAILSACYAGFRVARTAAARSRFLISMMVTSSSLWIFVLSSLVFCMLFVGQYESSPAAAIFFVARLSLASSTLLGAGLVLLLRRRALGGIYATIVGAQSVPDKESSAEQKTISRISMIFRYLVSKNYGPQEDPSLHNVRPILIRSESGLPASLAFDWKGSKLVAIKEDTVNILDDEELEAVVAHELGHIKRKDALQKSIATAYRIAFPFDLVIRLVEAAIYRERELLADEFSAHLTKKPVSLASALLKIYECAEVKPSMMFVKNNAPQISYLASNANLKKKFGGNDLFSKEPPLERRIQLLLEMDKKE